MPPFNERTLEISVQSGVMALKPSWVWINAHAIMRWSLKQVLGDERDKSGNEFEMVLVQSSSKINRGLLQLSN